MTDKEKLKVVQNCYNDIVWMAIRYAHGRMTYAPSMVRHSIKQFKKVFPDWEVGEDKTIKPPDTLNIMGLKDDYLNDLFPNNNE
ncbi:MAG TPA: hypothetical protein V6C58_04145 [Allocoleopsis sp.]